MLLGLKPRRKSIFSHTSLYTMINNIYMKNNNKFYYLKSLEEYFKTFKNV